MAKFFGYLERDTALLALSGMLAKPTHETLLKGSVGGHLCLTFFLLVGQAG